MPIMTTLEMSFIRQNKSKHIKITLNVVQIHKHDVDVFKFKTRCGCSNTNKLTALKFSPKLCGMNLVIIPN